MSRLWLWKNFVNGNPEFWAFDNPFPTQPNGDPMVFGEPVGYAVFKESRAAPKAAETSDEQVISAIQRASAPPAEAAPAKAVDREAADIIAASYAQKYTNRSDSLWWCGNLARAYQAKEAEVERLSQVALDRHLEAHGNLQRAEAAERREGELREALTTIDQSRFSDRHTVNPDNAFEHFSKLNQKYIEMCDLARKALGATP